MPLSREVVRSSAGMVDVVAVLSVDWVEAIGEWTWNDWCRG